MKVLIGCEYSGRVRDAFIAAGHDAKSCDLLPTESPGPHYEGDVRDIIGEGWDLAIFHPPCTYLSNSGVRWLSTDPDRWPLMRSGALFFADLLNSGIPRIAIENPVPHKYALEVIGRKYDQTVQPYEFGHLETKRTCLWLKNLPKLTPTTDLKSETLALPAGERGRIHYESPGPDRWKRRSTTFEGIAAAMAEQWGLITV